MESDREWKCMREIFSDNRIEFLMCHAIGIDRDKELEYNNHESNSTPEEERIFECLRHLSSRETLLEGDNTIDHITEKYRLKQEERREEEIREDEENYRLPSLSEEKKDFFECLKHKSLFISERKLDFEMFT